MDEYAGKNVIVTGATSEVGGKIARKLWKARVNNLVLFIQSDKGDLDQKTYNTFVGNA